jgi:hypothetical protein
MLVLILVTKASVQTNAPGKPCPDCEGLKRGTRSSQDPHQYLVLSGRSNSNPPVETYRCLVCASDLTFVRNGKMGRWS